MLGIDVSCSLCYHVHINMSCKTLQWIVLISVLVALLSAITLNEDSSILLSVIMIHVSVIKCNSDCVSFLQSSIFAHISVFRCRGYVMIPNHAQKRSYPQIMAVRDKES